MKQLFTIVCLLFVLNTFGQSNSESHKILAVLQTQQAAWNKGDIDAFMMGYQQSDSLLFVGSSDPTYGWQTTLDNYKKGYPDKNAMGFLTFDIKKVNLLAKDAAFVMGSWSLKRAADNPHGYFTLLFKKLNGNWKIAVDHTSSSKE